MDKIVLFTIISMTAVTYFTRFGGLLIISRINPSPAIRSFLKHVPASILVAIIIPALVDKGPPEIISAFITAMTAIFTRSLIASLLAGLFSISLLRMLVFI